MQWETCEVNKGYRVPSLSSKIYLDVHTQDFHDYKFSFLYTPFQLLRSAKNLTSLKIAHTPITTEVMNGMCSNCKELTFPKLDYLLERKLTRKCEEHVSYLNCLRVLEMSDVIMRLDKVLIAISKGYTNLSQLGLTRKLEELDCIDLDLTK